MSNLWQLVTPPIHPERQYRQKQDKAPPLESISDILFIDENVGGPIFVCRWTRTFLVLPWGCFVVLKKKTFKIKALFFQVNYLFISPPYIIVAGDRLWLAEGGMVIGFLYNMYMVWLFLVCSLYKIVCLFINN